MAAVCSAIHDTSRTILHYAVAHSTWQNSGMDIRERIRWAIEQNPELTIRNVSLEAGLSDSALHKFLTSQTTDLKLGTVSKLAEALNVDAVWLAYGEGDPERATDLGDKIAQLSLEDRATVAQLVDRFVRTGTGG